MLANRAVLFLWIGLVVVLALAYALTYWRYRRYWSRQEPSEGPQPDRRYYRDVLALAVLLGLVAGFFWRPLFTKGVTIPNGGGDLASFFYPIHVFASESLHSGEFPLWNPHLFAGMPFEADIQSGLFYPLNWLFWWLGYPITYEKVEMLALVHYWLAAAFTYAFGRSLGLGRWPAVLAGTLYAFSGFAVAHLGHLPMLAAATWLPLILLAVNQAARLKGGAPSLSARWAVAAGLFLAISFMAGHFQLFVYNFYAAVIFWLALAWRQRSRLVQPPEKSLIRRFWQNYWVMQLRQGAICGIVLAGATLVQVWPFYEMGQLSVRSAIGYETSTQFGVWPIGLIDLLLPDLFSPNPREYFGPWNNTEVLGYIGLFTFALVGLSLLLRPANRSYFYAVFFVGLGVAGLIFSLSGYTIFQGWFFRFVPALSLTRGSGRFLDWFDFGFAVAAAFGLQSWLEYRARSPEPEAERTLRWSWRTLALAGVAILLIPLPLLYSQVLSSPGQINDLVLRGINGLVIALIVVGLGAVLLRLFYRRTPGPDAAALLALALIVFDLFTARADFNPEVGDAVSGFSHDATAAFLRSQDPGGQYRIDDSVGSVIGAWQPDTAQVYGLYDVRGLVNPLQLATYENFWNGVTGAQKDFRAVPAYNLLGARYVIARFKEDPVGSQYKVVHRDDRDGIKLNVWENSQALPRAFVVHRTTLKPAADILPAMLAPDFKPAELAYLENGRALNGPTAAQSGEDAKLTEQSANHLTVEANLSSEGYLVLNQAYYPGWKVKVDGAEATLEKANYTFEAVYLPAGKHTVSFEFAPLSFTLGLIVSALTWLGALVFLAWALLRRNLYKNKKFWSRQHSPA